MIKYFEKHRKFCLLIAVLIGISIYYLSSLSFPKGPPLGFQLLPTIYHFLIFLVFAFFLLIGIVGKKKDKTLISIVILFVLVYAMSDEIHQLFVPNRNCTIEDFLIDSAGILLSSIFYTKLKFKK